MSFQFHFKKSILALLLLFSMSVLTISGCAKSNEKTSSGKKVVLNEVAHSIFYAPMYAAIEEGYFQEEGIDLEIVTGFGAISIVQKTILYMTYFQHLHTPTVPYLCYPVLCTSR